MFLYSLFVKLLVVEEFMIHPEPLLTFWLLFQGSPYPNPWQVMKRLLLVIASAASLVHRMGRKLQVIIYAGGM